MCPFVVTRLSHVLFGGFGWLQSCLEFWENGIMSLVNSGNRRWGRTDLVVMAALAGLVLAGAGAHPAWGQVTGSDPFSLRLPAALGRFSPYADVAGVGNASAASRWASSAIPAAGGWLDWPAGRSVAMTPQYSTIGFRQGPRLHVASEAATVDLGKWGRLQPAFAQVWADEGKTRQDLDFDFNLSRYQMNWGKKINDDWALGAGFQFSRSQAFYDMGPIDISKSSSDAYGFTLGTLNRICGPLLGGAVVQYSFSRDRTTMFGIPQFDIPETQSSDTTHELTFRPGLSYEYAKDSMVLLDYQFGTYFNHEGSIRVHRFFTGVDHRIFDWLFIRGGLAMDTRAHTGLTCGVGIYPCDAFTIDIGYQEDMFPEVRHEFGRSRTFTISLGITF